MFIGHRWEKLKHGWSCYLSWTRSESWEISWNWGELAEKYWICKAEISLLFEFLSKAPKMTAYLTRFKADSVKACFCCKWSRQLLKWSVSSSSSPSPCLLLSIGKLWFRVIVRRNGKAACGRCRCSLLRRVQLLERCIRLSSKSLKVPFGMPHWHIWWRRGFSNRLQ